jgi:hypothetical protein
VIIVLWLKKHVKPGHARYIGKDIVLGHVIDACEERKKDM